MALTRLYEEHEVAPELRRLYADIRSGLDLPFVPSLFKLCAGIPEYLKILWHDLGPVIRSPEFDSASAALEEFTRSQAISDGWRFPDQQRVLAAQKFSAEDIDQVAAIVGIFTRSLPRMLLVARLAQRGYSGGQAGRASSAKPLSAFSRLITLHVPNERDAGLRVWLIYNDMKKTTGSSNVLSIFRVVSPFPGYLASVWVEAKKIMREESFLRARDHISKRALGLLTGLPVRDHRAMTKHITEAQWTDIEQAVDGFARLLPQFALLAAVWRRSFPTSFTRMLAA